METRTLFDDFFPSHFGNPTRHVEYILAEKIKSQYPQHQHLVVMDQDSSFAVPAYLKHLGIASKVTEKHRTHYFDYSKDKVASGLKVGLIEFIWKGTDFLVYKFSWPDPAFGTQVMFVLIFQGKGETKAEKETIGEELLSESYKWGMGLDKEMYVFVDGRWIKDKKLWESIQMSQWDNLVLDKEFVAGLKRDTETFFSSRQIYQSLEIPWKRGILLLGEVLCLLLF